jgi:hypothetical protein
MHGQQACYVALGTITPGKASLLLEDVMALYFFNVLNDVKTKDFNGVELPNLEAARREARKDIDDIVRSHFNILGSNWSKWSIEICDKDGKLLLTVPFSIN